MPISRHAANKITFDLLKTLQLTKADFRGEICRKIGHDKERSLEDEETSGLQKRSPKGFKVESTKDKDGKEHFNIVPIV